MAIGLGMYYDGTRPKISPGPFPPDFQPLLSIFNGVHFTRLILLPPSNSHYWLRLLISFICLNYLDVVTFAIGSS